MVKQALPNSYSRVWFCEGGPGPSRNLQYFGNWKAGSPSWDQGKATTIREPDPNNYGKFVRVGRFRGEPGDPTLPITARYGKDRSRLLKAARANCTHMLQVRMGDCKNPQDPFRGWDKILILEDAYITTWGTDDLGALSPDQNGAINETVPFDGTDLYEITPMTFTEMTPTLVSREITSVWVCDSQTCQSCGVGSDGCQLVLALEGVVTASPGQAPTLIWTRDGGSTWTEIPITSLSAVQVGTFVVCVGTNVVVGSADSDSIHYTSLASLLAGTQTWTQMATGFVATHGPLAAFSIGASETWFVGEGGYIYFTDDPTSAVTLNNAANTTTQDLNDVHAYDSNNVLAVGAGNTVVYTTNGGVSWASAVGPSVGIVLNTCWMRSPTEWMVGTAGGRLYYTIDAGVTWTEVTFPGSGAGQVRDIVFTTPAVGYMAHSTAAPTGRILRTLDGGGNWYVMPEGSSGNLPTNAYLKSLAVCADPNIVFGGGLKSGVDGILVKGA